MNFIFDEEIARLMLIVKTKVEHEYKKKYQCYRTSMIVQS